MIKKITVTEALKELKLYDAKINKSIETGAYVGAAKVNSDKIGHKTKENFVSDSKSDYQSVIDLIKNRAKIKSAIVKSNAETTLEINGVKMTRAEAIERKSSIEYDKKLLNELKSQFYKATVAMEKENKKVDQQCEAIALTAAGKDSDKKVKGEEIESVTETIRRLNEFGLVDPLGIEKVINDLEAEIDGFESEVDVRLNLSNATTFIEVDM